MIGPERGAPSRENPASIPRTVPDVLCRPMSPHAPDLGKR